MNVKIVIGSNYGDEGKGLASRYFAQKAEGSCLTVLHNGGAQRGHTVDYLEDKRFVYHHLACGTADGSDTYFEQNFIINPILFSIIFPVNSPRYRMCINTIKATC